MDGLKENLRILDTGSREAVSNLKLPTTERKVLVSFFPDECIEEATGTVETYGTLKRDAIINETTAVRLLCKLRQHASIRKKAPSEFLARFGNTLFSFADLEQLEKIHKCKKIVAMVKEEKAWFKSLPQFIAAGRKQIPMQNVHQFRELIHTARNDEKLECLQGFSPSEVCSVVGNRWISSHVIDLISSLINTQSESSKVTVVSASRVKLASNTGTLEKLFSQMKIDDETKMLIITCNVGGEKGVGNNIQFDKRGNHWALLVFDLQNQRLVYCDSLCKMFPRNSDKLVIPILGILGKEKSKFMVSTTHAVNKGFSHKCTNDCSVFPIQVDGESCGVITIIMAAILADCPDGDKMHFLSPGSQRDPDDEPCRQIPACLKNPSIFKAELRCIIISWIVEGRVDTELILPRHSSGQKATATTQTEAGEAICFGVNSWQESDSAATRSNDPLSESDGETSESLSMENKEHAICSDAANATIGPAEFQQLCSFKDGLKHASSEDPANNSCTVRISSQGKELTKIIIKKRKIERENGELSFGVNNKHMKLLIPCCSKEWYSCIRDDIGDDETPNAEAKTRLIKDFPIKSTEETLISLDALDLQASSEWYEQQCKLAKINEARSKSREENKCIEDSRYQRVAMVRSKVTGDLVTNMSQLRSKISKTDSQKLKAELSGIAKVGEALLAFPIILTNEAATIYEEAKLQLQSTTLVDEVAINKKPGSFYESLAKHLNLAQIYVNGRAFLVDRVGGDICKALERIEQVSKSFNSQTEVKEHVKAKIGETFKQCLEYMDSTRDKDVLKYVIANITSVKAATELAGVQNREGIKRSKAVVDYSLGKFSDMKSDMEKKFGDLHKDQRKAVIRRAMEAYKIKELRHIFTGNKGRKLKCTEFPDLAAVLEFHFGERDRAESGNGGLESHPKLKNEIMYKADCNSTKMRDARELLMAAAGPDFRISLSSCYNYTMNYKKGTSQAKRHHDGKGINANISLHKAPDTKAIKDLVINAHWCSANANYMLDHASQHPQKFLIDSKDAKAIVRAGEKQGGKTWRSIELEDHSFQDESRKNAVTPMAHLFVSTVVAETVERPVQTIAEGEIGIAIQGIKKELLLRIKRTGRGTFLINLSFYEPETVFRAMNEIFHLMAIPAMDSFFRLGPDGNLPDNLVFLVDNGASEKPRSPLVRMCLVRMCHFLQRHTITQISFAEYHSKRNIAERLNAAAQTGLQSCAVLGQNVSSTPGSEEHRNEMEAMALEVQSAIMSQQFGGNPILVFRGVKDDFIFKDEEALQHFLKLSEEGKANCKDTYAITQNETSQTLSLMYGFNNEFKSTYCYDYEVLTNSTGERTAWCDKYTTTIYNGNVPKKDFINMQPVPDYVRWYQSNGQLHYMPYEGRGDLKLNILKEIPELFLPSSILLNARLVFPSLDGDITHALALMCWCTEEEVIKYYDEMARKEQAKFENAIKQATWSKHEIYAQHTVAQLREQCKDHGLSTEGPKHDLANRLAIFQDVEIPAWENYKGDPSKVPHDLKGLMHLPLASLKEIMKFHGYNTDEKKEVLALRVLCIRAGEANKMYHREIENLLRLVGICKRIVLEEKVNYDSTIVAVYRQRQFTLERITESEKRPRERAGLPAERSKSVLSIPPGTTFDNMFKSLENLLLSLRGKRITCAENVSLFMHVGMYVIIYWLEDKDQGWDAGWYSAKIVGAACKNRAVITVEYRSEPDCFYDIDVESALADGILMISKHLCNDRNIDMHCEAMEVGAIIEIQIGRKDSKIYGVEEGWSEATVQGYSPDDDTITVVFLENLEQTFSIPLSPLIAAEKMKVIQAVF